MMKKYTARVLILALVLTISVLTLASCGRKLSGTYADGDFSMSFDGSHVTISDGTHVSVANYSIKDEKEKTYIYVTFKKGDFDFDFPAEKLRLEEGDGSITVAGLKLTEQK